MNKSSNWTCANVQMEQLFDKLFMITLEILKESQGSVIKPVAFELRAWFDTACTFMSRVSLFVNVSRLV